MVRPPARKGKSAGQVADRHRKRPGIVNVDSIPARDTDDAYGNPFLGLPGNRLRVNAISNDELGPNAVLNGNIGEQINATKLPNIAGLDGDLPESKLPNIPKNKLPNDTVYLVSGRVPKGELPNEVIYGNAQGQLSYRDLLDKPHLGRFLTEKDIQNKATHQWVKNYVRKHVKPSARR